jgi:UDP-3-O-[3-hydroxymyristoyl] glucosamine N-acyltransferase
LIRAACQEQEIRRAIGVPGGGELTLEGVAALDERQDRFLYFVTSELGADTRHALASLQGCLAIVPSGSVPAEGLGGCRFIESDDPRAAIAKVLTFIRSEHRQQPWVTAARISLDAQVSPLALIDGDVEIGGGSIVDPFCTVGPDVSIGRNVRIHAGVRLYPRTRIGDGSVIGANSVIGHEGYGFVRDPAGNKWRIPHLGGVVIGCHVDIGALAVVQSGALVATTIADYAKIDDNVEVGHGARVGRNASVTGGVVIGGSASIEDEAWVGINSSIRDGRRVGRGALIGMDTSVQRDVEDAAVARAPRPAVTRRREPDPRAIGFSGRKPR